MSNYADNSLTHKESLSDFSDSYSSSSSSPSPSLPDEVSEERALIVRWGGACTSLCVCSACASVVVIVEQVFLRFVRVCVFLTYVCAHADFDVSYDILWSSLAS